MAKKVDIEEIRRKIRFATYGIVGGYGCKKSDFEMAQKDFRKVVKYIKEAIGQDGREEETRSDAANLTRLLCMASFGQGLTEGLFEMKIKTYRSRYRDHSEIVSNAKRFVDACADLKQEPHLPENHLRVGRGYGVMGLVKESRIMLENGYYWDSLMDHVERR